MAGLYDGTVAVYDVRLGCPDPILSCTDAEATHTDPVWQVRHPRPALLSSTTATSGSTHAVNRAGVAADSSPQTRVRTRRAPPGQVAEEGAR